MYAIRSYYVHWVRAEIHEFILRNWRIVKVATTKAQRKLFFNLRGAKKRLGWMNREEIAAVAKDLGVKPETVVEMESRLSGQDLCFDPAVNEDEDDAHRYAVITSYSIHYTKLYERSWATAFTSSWLNQPRRSLELRRLKKSLRWALVVATLTMRQFFRNNFV